MADLDIVISLNPQQPVQAAAKVTEAVAKIETQSKDAQKALDAVSLNSAKAQDALSAAAEKQAGKFKQGAAAAAAAFGLLDAKLHLTETAIGRTLVEASKFAALGAQVGGPWGAALGATAVLADKLGDALGLKIGMMTKAIDELEARQKKAGLAVGDVTKKIEALGGAMTNFAQNASLVNRTTHSMAEGFRSLADAASSVPDWLMRVGLGFDPWDPNKTKKKLDKIFGPKGEKQYFNGLSPLSVEPDAIRTPYMGLGERADGGTGPFGVDLIGNYDLVQQTQDSLNEKIKANTEETLRLAENTRKWNEELVQTNITAQVVSEVLTKAASSFADTLVDAANGADVSWREWGANMLVMLEKVIAQALVLKAIGATTGGVGGGGTGLLGLLFGGAHATGGSYTAPATGGGPDSIPVMFRMSPRETATFTPHGQAFGGSAGGGSTGAINLTVAPQIHDERAIHASMAAPGGQRVIYQVFRQAMGAVRPLG